MVRMLGVPSITDVSEGRPLLRLERERAFEEPRLSDRPANPLARVPELSDRPENSLARVPELAETPASALTRVPKLADIQESDLARPPKLSDPPENPLTRVSQLADPPAFQDLKDLPLEIRAVISPDSKNGQAVLRQVHTNGLAHDVVIDTGLAQPVFQTHAKEDRTIQFPIPSTENRQEPHLERVKTLPLPFPAIQPPQPRQPNSSAPTAPDAVGGEAAVSTAAMRTLPPPPPGRAEQALAAARAALRTQTTAHLIGDVLYVEKSRVEDALRELAHLMLSEPTHVRRVQANIRPERLIQVVRG